MKAVMYHYVREYNAKAPRFRFLDVQNFRLQLDYFEQHFGFVSQDEWRAFLADGTMPLGKVVLTFDDATSCHYNYVFPELVKRGLWGVFYVPTLPYVEEKMLDVHRVHLLCGALDARDLLSSALTKIDDSMIPDSKRAEFREKTYETQENYAGVSEFKRLVNYFLHHEHKEWLLDQLGDEFGVTFDPKSFYVPRPALKEMAQANMTLGSHTHTHPVMSKLNPELQNRELHMSFRFLEDAIGESGLKTYCHPYGGFHTFDDATVGLLGSYQVDFAFNVEGRDIDATDHEQSKFFLPRYDCNMFEHGKAS